MKREVVLACVLTAFVVSAVFTFGLHLGRAQQPSSTPISSPPRSQQVFVAPASAPRPDTSALDNKVADYNIDLHQLDQDEQQIKNVEAACDATTDTEAEIAGAKQLTAILSERNDLGERSLAAYHEIVADPNFASHYRETVYTTAHGVETLAAWSNLRYITIGSRVASAGNTPRRPLCQRSAVQ